ncbi:MAG TPA: AI-2E family transporter [Chitinispirillaceae bacterium]|jgi:predicted PurR-regulated permease PerM|nr:AI-2E family transporter [Chitinispirillaceae bacterium]
MAEKSKRKLKKKIKPEEPVPEKPLKEDNSEAAPRDSRQTPGKLLSHATVLILLLAASIAFFPMAYIFLVPLALAATISALTFPVYKFLLKKLRNKKFLVSFICCAGLILLVLIPLYIFIHLIVNQIIEILPTAIPWVREFLKTWREQPIIAWFLKTPIGKYAVDQVEWESVGQEIIKNSASAASLVLNRTYAGVFGVAFDLLMAILLLFYFYIDGERIIENFKSLLPIKKSQKDMIVSRFTLISRATVLGTLIIGLVDGLLGGLTLLIFGVKGWLIWGFIMVILSILPVVGVSIVLVPIGIVQILIGRVWQGIGILVTHFLVVSNADNVIRPRVVGSSARMHDVIILISTIGGLSIFGITGFIIGPIIASFFLTALDIYKEEFCEDLPEGCVNHASQKPAIQEP